MPRPPFSFLGWHGPFHATKAVTAWAMTAQPKRDGWHAPLPAGEGYVLARHASACGQKHAPPRPIHHSSLITHHSLSQPLADFSSLRRVLFPIERRVLAPLSPLVEISPFSTSRPRLPSFFRPPHGRVACPSPRRGGGMCWKHASPLPAAGKAARMAGQAAIFVSDAVAAVGALVGDLKVMRFFS